MRHLAKTGFREKISDIHANNISILKERIKSGEISGCYMFYGDEEYTKNHYCKLLTDEAGSNLNVTTFFKSEFILPDFLAACETSAVESFDMFSMDNDEEESDNSSYRVIKLIDPDFSTLTKKDEDYLLEFLAEPPEKAIIIFWFYAGENEAISKGLFKSISEKSLIINFKREPIGSNILITWILRHFAKEKLNVDRHVAVHLCQVVGNSMTDLSNEIDKLIDYLRFENRDTLEVKDIDFICIKSTAAQIFDISSGALAGDFKKAARALGVLRDKKEKPIVILGTISKAVFDLCMVEQHIKCGTPIPAIAKETGIFEFVVKNDAAILSSRKHDFHGNDSFTKTASRLCLEYDTKLKSSRTDGYELLLELIFKISFAGRTSTR